MRLVIVHVPRRVLPFLALLAAVACAPTAPPDDPRDPLGLPGGAVTGLVRDVGGTALAGVKVTAVRGGPGSADITASTDDAGRFLLRGVVPAGHVRVDFEREDYAPSQQLVVVTDREVSTSPVFLKALGPAHQVDAAQGATIQEGKVTVKLPPGALDASGNVELRIATLDPSGPEVRGAPGDYRGKTGANESQLASFGMVFLQAKQDGRTVDLKPGQTVPITIEIPQQPAGPPLKDGDKVPAWTYDPDSGVWTEVGSGEVKQNVAGGGKLTWTADAPTTRLWFNCDHPVPTTCVDGKVVDCAGNAIPGARVQANGLTYNGTGGGNSGAGGRYRVSPVGINAQVQMVASVIIGGKEYKGEVGPIHTAGGPDCTHAPNIRIAIPDLTGNTTVASFATRGEVEAPTTRIAAASYKSRAEEPPASCDGIPSLNSCMTVNPGSGDPRTGGGTGGANGQNLSNQNSGVENTLDVGDQIQLDSASDSISLDRKDSENGPYYLGMPTNFGEGADVKYRIAAPGAKGGIDGFTVTDAVRVPAQVELSGLDGQKPTVVASNGLSLGWQGGDANATMTLQIIPKAQNANQVVCIVDDQVGFTVPASELSKLPKGDATVFATRARVHFYPLPDGDAAMGAGVTGVAQQVELK
jgi:hypothetical protein